MSDVYKEGLGPSSSTLRWWKKSWCR